MDHMEQLSDKTAFAVTRCNVGQGKYGLRQKRWYKKKLEWSPPQRIPKPQVAITRIHMSIVTHSIGNKEFILDQEKAEAAFSAKKIINGRDTMTFNLLPLKYKWAYEIYKNMKAG